MATETASLPQNGGRLFLTDGGIETVLIFQEGLDLPHFAAFPLLASPSGTSVLRRYFETYAALAKHHKTGLILESATWRANPDWGTKLGYTKDQLATAVHDAVNLLVEVRDKYRSDESPMVISGCIGPRGDGYVPDRAMSVASAKEYHLWQIRVFAGTQVEMVCAITMNYVEEAIGIAAAAKEVGIPVAISFTLETDGKLPTGQDLGSAILQVDQATSRYPEYYMINCAHPTHFDGVLLDDGGWRNRIRGLRANASKLSHAELNEASNLDDGNPDELAAQYASLRARLPKLNVMGGCCGTDHRHVAKIAAACVPLF